MNPAEIAASPLAAPAADITIWSMFWGAHIVVKIVMVGLLAASVWCWAIIIDKTLLFARMRRAMDRFEESFWSGNSLEELYGKLSERPTDRHGDAVRRRHAGMEALLPGGRQRLLHGPAGAHREGARRLDRPRGREA